MSNRVLLVVGGTWERQPYGLLGDVVVRVRTDWTPRWVSYPASYGTPESYDKSKGDGKLQLRLHLMEVVAFATDIAIIDYSQGCAIVDELLAEMTVSAAAGGDASNFTRRVLSKIRYVGHVANPHRPRGVQVGADPGGFGISGPLALTPAQQNWMPRRENFALPGDLICACPPDSLIRIVEHLTPMMSQQDPWSWGADLRKKLTIRYLWSTFPELRNPTPAGLWRLKKRIDTSIADAVRYETSGVHMKYVVNPIGGINRTATAHIAQQLHDIAWSRT